jgi:hypothetical protein
MPRFDFVSGTEFASSLASDQREFESCLECGAWKAAVVLAGSIVEAVLVDYLVSLGYTGNGKRDALKMDLSEVITTCYNDKILTEKARDLTSVIRQYRNLIHPGRAVRLGESVGQPEARSAQALLDIIIADVVKHREKTYGYTAEQIVAKLSKDSSCLSILPQLLEETRPTEQERLLVDVIPREYFNSEEDVLDFGSYTRSLQDAYRLVFNKAEEPIKKRAVAQLVRVLRSGDQRTVYAFEEAFFVGGDLKYLSDSDRRLVKTHLLARLKTDKGKQFLHALAGIGPYLAEKAEIEQFVYPLARLAAEDYGPARNRLISENLNGKQAQDAYVGALRSMVRFYGGKGEPRKVEAARLSQLTERIAELIDIPF